MGLDLGYMHQYWVLTHTGAVCFWVHWVRGGSSRGAQVCLPMLLKAHTATSTEMKMERTIVVSFGILVMVSYSDPEPHSSPGVGKLFDTWAKKCKSVKVKSKVLQKGWTRIRCVECFGTYTF